MAESAAQTRGMQVDQTDRPGQGRAPVIDRLCAPGSAPISRRSSAPTAQAVASSRRRSATRARATQLIGRRSQLGLQPDVLHCQSRSVTRGQPDRDDPAPSRARTAVPHQPERGHEHAQADQRSAGDPAHCLRCLSAQGRHRRTPRPPRSHRNRPWDASSNRDEHRLSRSVDPAWRPRRPSRGEPAGSA